ncbi:tetracycline-efflux transporter-like protein [Melanomma pulvis-pyrius CBS 109.77]|uniref:Tetracycline-efflux transporter-like protein n=1 Tax=Melanomma pulvis-pyrius CBS 109.77 TaxID=1314802 RepID=A0A6A6X4N6_9PLEO|nr:tetracycline-efflux transporter-like protein [Melanomma pulvis-pyrius CBS 109.77]
MATNDAAFAGDADIDEQMRSRSSRSASALHTRHAQSGRSGQSSPALEYNGEEEPLLGSAGSSRGSVGSGSGSEPQEWFGTAELSGLPWWKRPSIFWLLPPFLLFTTAYGGIIVPKMNLIIDLICRDYFADQENDPLSGITDPDQRFDQCQNPDVSSRASLFLLYASLCSGILSAITSPKIGALSDRYGRKLLLVITTSGVLVGEILTIIAAKYPEVVSVNWILVGYAADGLCGSFIVGMALAHSYAADCTPPQRRNVAFGYFHACLFTGIAIGPILSGYLIEAREKAVGRSEAVLLVFYIALACHCIFILFLLLVIPESLSKTRQEAARARYNGELELLGPDWDWINQLRSVNLLAPLKILWPTGPGSSSPVRWNLVLLAATDTIMFGVAMGAMSVVVMYMRLQFNWKEFESSKFVSIVNSCRVVSLLVVLPLITRLVRGKTGTKKQKNSGSDLFDLTIIRISILFDMLGYLGYSLVRDGNLFIISGTIASIGGMGSPTLGSALTKHVPPDRVGQLMGAMGLLHALSRVIGPTIFNGIYSATVKSFRQAVFVCLAATFGFAFLCSWFVRPHVYLEDLEPDGSPLNSGSADDEEEECH